MASQVESIKWVPGTSMMVDGFAFTNPRCKVYFLTHCHSDHTVGLTNSFNAGTIWCSPVSARLLEHDWGLRAPTVQVLQLNQTVVIEGVTVTALDANHCPGSMMLLFEVPCAGGGPVKRILHTGDCRWHDGLYTGSCLAHTRIDTLMLDTTYALPKHTFPPQQEAVNSMVQLMREALDEEPATLLVCSCYSIGKERAYLGAAAALGLKVYVPPNKMRLLQMLDLPQQLMGVVTTTDSSAQLHVGWCTNFSPNELQAYLARQQQQQQQQQGAAAAAAAAGGVGVGGGRQWARIMAFKATGWQFRRSGGTRVQRPLEGVAIAGVPYSEHSSWSELRACVARLQPKRLIPTVNAATPKQRAALVDRFVDLLDLSNNRGRIDAYLTRKPAAAAAAAAGDDGGGDGESDVDSDCVVISATDDGDDDEAAAAEAEAEVAPLPAQPPSPPAASPAWEQAGSAGAVGLCGEAEMVPASSDHSCGGDILSCCSGPLPTASPPAPAAEGADSMRLEPGQQQVWQPPPLQQQQAAAPSTPGGKPQPPPGQLPQSQPHQASAPATDISDWGCMADVDMAEQRRLLEDAERRQRLKRSLQLQQAAKRAKQRTRRRGSAAAAAEDN